MTHTVFAAFVLCPAIHTLFFINSQCKQACQLGDDYTIVAVEYMIVKITHKRKYEIYL